MKETIFQVNKDLQARLREKWSGFTIGAIDAEELTFGSSKIQVETRIAKDFLNINIDEMKAEFETLCAAFTKTCNENNVPCAPLDINIVMEDEIQIDCFLTTIMQDSNNGRIFALILVSPDLLKIQSLRVYAFLHELAHCWINTKASLDANEMAGLEIFTDLVAICAFRQFVSPHERLYEFIIENLSYFGSDDCKEFLAESLYKQILEDPESSLKKYMIILKDKLNERKNLKGN